MLCNYGEKSRNYFAMTGTKLIQVLKTFSKEELNDFVKFTASPFFSTGRDLSPLLYELKKFFPEYEHPNLNEAYIYGKLYPGKKFGDARSNSLMKTLTSELFKLAKEFLAYIEYNKDESRKDYYRMDQLRKRKLYKEYEREYASIKKEPADFNGMDGMDLLSLHYNKHTYAEFCVETGRGQQCIDSIISMGENAMAYALILGFRHNEVRTTAVHNKIGFRSNLTDVVLENLELEKVLEFLDSSGSPFYPYIAVNYTLHMMSSGGETEQYFFRLRELVDKYESSFSRTELYILCCMMSSYCSKVTENSFNKIFMQEQFKLYDWSLKLGVYKHSTDEEFNILNFRNIVITALDVNEIEWTEDFIMKYYKELRQDYSENMKDYSLAHVYYNKKQPEKALEHIIKIKYDHFIFQLDAKYLLFKIYYELNYDEQAFSILSTISQYVINTKHISEHFRQRGNNFVKFGRELLKRRAEKNLKDIELFRRKIKGTEFVNAAYWLLRKIDELEGE